MTLDDMARAVRAIQGVHGGCSFCERSAMKRLMILFPRYQIWQREQDERDPSTHGDIGIDYLAVQDKRTLELRIVRLDGWEDLIRDSFDANLPTLPAGQS